MLVAFGTKVKLNNYPFPQKTSFIQHEELQSWTTSISIKPSGDSGKALVASWLLHTLPRHNRFGIVHTRQDILHVGGNHIHSVPNLHSCHRDFETYSARSALQETFEVLWQTTSSSSVEFGILCHGGRMIEEAPWLSETSTTGSCIVSDPPEPLVSAFLEQYPSMAMGGLWVPCWFTT